MTASIEPSASPLRPYARSVPGVGPRAAAIDRLFARLTVVAMSLLIATDVLGGAIRFVLSTLGIPFASYLPMLFCAGLAIAYFVRLGVVSRLDPRVFAILGFFIAYTVYSLLNGASAGLASLARVAFALYTWTPFFLGIVLACQGAEMKLPRSAGMWWALAISGVVMNRFVHFPWTGSTFEVLGQQSEVARDWTTNGLERLAGFSRASFTAANEITVFGILLLIRPRTSAIKRVTIWLVSTAAVALTTSKTPLAALLFVPVALWIQQPRRKDEGHRPEGRFRLAMASLGTLMAAMVILPASSTTQELLLKYSFKDVGFLTLSSMLDRTATMWPGAFALITADRSAFAWLLGRGLGGIGSAQNIFEPLDANSADNLFVFLYVTFGAPCAAFGFAIFSRFRTIYREKGYRFILFFALAATVLTLGMAANVVESIVPALALGIVAGKSAAISSTSAQPLTVGDEAR